MIAHSHNSDNCNPIADGSDTIQNEQARDGGDNVKTW